MHCPEYLHFWGLKNWTVHFTLFEQCMMLADICKEHLYINFIIDCVEKSNALSRIHFWGLNKSFIIDCLEKCNALSRIFTFLGVKKLDSALHFVRTFHELKFTNF